MWSAQYHAVLPSLCMVSIARLCYFTWFSAVVPSIASNTSVYTTNETAPVTFQCSSTGIPAPSISWYRNGTALVNNTRISISSPLTVLLEFDLYQVTQTLTITNTADTDSGNYSCVGNNTAGTDSNGFELIIQCELPHSVHILKLSIVSKQFLRVRPLLLKH